MARLIALLSLFCASACTTYTITEDKVFTPITAYEMPDTEEDLDLSLRW